jgi:hypothetical protein
MRFILLAGLIALLAAAGLAGWHDVASSVSTSTAERNYVIDSQSVAVLSAVSTAVFVQHLDLAPLTRGQVMWTVADLSSTTTGTNRLPQFWVLAVIALANVTLCGVVLLHAFRVSALPLKHLLIALWRVEAISAIRAQAIGVPRLGKKLVWRLHDSAYRACLGLRVNASLRFSLACHDAGLTSGARRAIKIPVVLVELVKRLLDSAGNASFHSDIVRCAA